MTAPDGAPDRVPALGALLPPGTTLALLAFVETHSVAITKAAHRLEPYWLSLRALRGALLLFEGAAIVLPPARRALFRYPKALIRQVVPPRQWTTMSRPLSTALTTTLTAVCINAFSRFSTCGEPAETHQALGSTSVTVVPVFSEVPKLIVPID